MLRCHVSRPARFASALMRPWPAAVAAHASAPGRDPRRSSNPKRAKTGEVGLRRSMDAPAARTADATAGGGSPKRNGRQRLGIYRHRSALWPMSGEPSNFNARAMARWLASRGGPLVKRQALGPRPTLAELQRSHCWTWVYCEKCLHHDRWPWCR
jgi:hypothetical protein